MEGECKSCGDGESMNAAIKPHPMGKIVPNTGGQVYARPWTPSLSNEDYQPQAATGIKQPGSAVQSSQGEPKTGYQGPPSFKAHGADDARAYEYPRGPISQRQAAPASLMNSNSDSTVEYLPQLKIAPWFEPRAVGLSKTPPGGGAMPTMANESGQGTAVEKHVRISGQMRGTYWDLYDEELKLGIESRKKVVRQFPDEVAELDKVREWCLEKAQAEYEACVENIIVWAAGMGILVGGIAGAGATVTSKSGLIGMVAAATTGSSTFIGVLLAGLMTCVGTYERAVAECEGAHTKGIKELYKKAGVPY